MFFFFCFLIFSAAAAPFASSLLNLFSILPHSIDSWQIRASVAQGYNAAWRRRATCVDLSHALHLLIDVTSRVFAGYLNLLFNNKKIFLFFHFACPNVLLLSHLLRNQSAGKTMRCAKFERTAAQATVRKLN